MLKPNIKDKKMFKFNNISLIMVLKTKKCIFILVLAYFAIICIIGIIIISFIPQIKETLLSMLSIIFGN